MYVPPVYPYVRCPDQDVGAAHRPVVVVGAGPVGLAMAIDLAQRGMPVVLLDDDDTVSVGSRAICHAKRSLEILDRLGVAQRVLDKGVRWNVGKVFFRDALAYQFDLLPEPGHRHPAFVNLQQYWLEQYLVERAQELPCLDLRWRHSVTAVTPHDDSVEIAIDTPDGAYVLGCDWLIACDGARSPVRHMLGLEAEGQVFRDRFLITDIHMTSHFPTERWFWFDPPFHRGQSVLLHRQADDIWRVDFQLGWQADPEDEVRHERIAPRLRAMLGERAEFTIQWASVYTFQCRRMRAFRHRRVFFAGDAAHLVSPFGARGANGGLQDADNLAWKLALVIEGRAPDALLDSYDVERGAAADENLRHSTRSTDFITPKTDASRMLRDAVLDLAKRHPFARALVNSGRLSMPAVLSDSPLNTPDRDDDFSRTPGAIVPGAPAIDAPVDGPQPWLLRLCERGFTLIVFDTSLDQRDVATLAGSAIACCVVQVGGRAPPGVVAIADREGLIARRYDARPGTVYLLRPDQHVCARWRQFDLESVRAAIARATCNA